MAYTAPPTFADGNTLSASQLNTLSDDVEYLYGVVHQTNPAVYGPELYLEYDDESTVTQWVIRHKTDKLTFTATCEQGTITNFWIKYGSTTVYTTGDNKTSGQSYTAPASPGYVDLSALGLTLGTWYAISVYAQGDAGESVSKLRVYDIREIV